jgi:hypothetical protein
MNDNDVYDIIESGMAGVHMRRPVEDIVARGRIRRRRQRVSVSVMAAFGLTVAMALSAPVIGGPADRPNGAQPLQVRMVGFALDGNTDGTVRLTFTHDQAADPAVLERELAKAGIRARVSIGRSCRDPRGAMAGVEAVVRDFHPADAGSRTAAWVIAPRAIPDGAHLSIGLYPFESAVMGFVVDFGLLADDAQPVCTGLPGPRPSRT